MLLPYYPPNSSEVLSDKANSLLPDVAAVPLGHLIKVEDVADHVDVSHVDAAGLLGELAAVLGPIEYIGGGLWQRVHSLHCPAEAAPDWGTVPAADLQRYAPPLGSESREAWDRLSVAAKRIAVAWERSKPGAVDALDGHPQRNDILLALGYANRPIVGT